MIIHLTYKYLFTYYFMGKSTYFNLKISVF
jgi:hypothetical protein